MTSPRTQADDGAKPTAENTSEPRDVAEHREANLEIASDLRGAGRLIVDAVVGVTGIVESMHRNISGLAPVVGPSRQGGTTGITGLVYRSIRGISRGVGFGLDFALAQLAPLLRNNDSPIQREAVSAALNGVLGDYLVASNNPLAISMRLRKDGRPLTLDRPSLQQDFPRPTARLVLWVHGLCMNDLQWLRNGHDPSASLARDLDHTALHLHYNTGQHISTNGRQFAELLERLVQAWPVPIGELVIVGFSMGGLVTRSACHYATQADYAWPDRLKKLIFLGTPHHGAPLERAGNWTDILMGISPYSAPLARLANIRSAGVKDLRYGNVIDADWQSVGSGHIHDPRNPVPLPENTRCFALAATQQPPSDLEATRAGARLRGDGLVPVDSALGRHENPELSLTLPTSHQRILYGLSHLDLLSDPGVCDQIYCWLTGE